MDKILAEHYQVLDKIIPFCLEQIAERYEALGDLRLRDACRYVIEQGYMPNITIDSYYWFITMSDHRSVKYQIPYPIQKFHKDVKPLTFSTVPMEYTVGFSTMWEAYWWLIQVVAIWQDSEKEKKSESNYQI